MPRAKYKMFTMGKAESKRGPNVLAASILSLKIRHQTMVMASFGYTMMTLLLGFWFTMDIWPEITFFLLLVSNTFAVVFTITMAWLWRDEVMQQLLGIISFGCYGFSVLMYWFGWLGLDWTGYRWFMMIFMFAACTCSLLAMLDNWLAPIVLGLVLFVIGISMIMSWESIFGVMSWLRWFIIIALVIGLVILLRGSRVKTVKKESPILSTGEARQSGATVPEESDLSAKKGKVSKIILVPAGLFVLLAVASIAGTIFAPGPLFPAWAIGIYDALTVVFIVQLIIGGVLFIIMIISMLF
jgi:hypothetical protein